MLNWIWLALIWGAVVYAAFTGRMEAVSKAAFDEAIGAVTLVLKLVGPMILFLGLMNVASQGGLLAAVLVEHAPRLGLHAHRDARAAQRARSHRRVESRA